MIAALIVTILIAAASAVWARWEHGGRLHWQASAQALERRVAVDEALLDQAYGPRRTADQVRGEGQ